jgi:triosephosphate isomerase
MGNRKPLIAGNWKMFKTCPEAMDTAARLAELTVDATVDVMIAPPFTALSVVAEAIKDSKVSLGAQDLFWETQGAFTSQISAPMLLSTGCSYVIIGHSERRQYFGETDETVNKKMRAAVNADLIPVLCIGETEKQRESKETFSVLDKQIKKGLKDFSSDDLGKLVVAYEPVWAIGTGKTATTAQAQEVHGFIRSLMAEIFSSFFAESVRILYGGSVKPVNIKELMGLPDIDGALVGGASLDAKVFSEIVLY